MLWLFMLLAPLPFADSDRGVFRSAYASPPRCYYVLEPGLQDLGLSVRHTASNNCQIRWRHWRSHAFQVHLHVYGIHEGEPYYVGGRSDGRQAFGHGRDLSHEFDAIWYDPIVIDGKIFYAATNGYVDGVYTNTVVYGDRVYEYGKLGGIPAEGPVIWQGEPALIVQTEDDMWAVQVGHIMDERKFAPVTRWGSDEPSIWRVRIKDGQLIYTAIDQNDRVLNYVWGE